MRVTSDMLNQHIANAMDPQFLGGGMSVETLRQNGAATCAVPATSAIPNARYRIEEIPRPDGSSLKVCVYTPLTHVAAHVTPLTHVAVPVAPPACTETPVSAHANSTDTEAARPLPGVFWIHGGGFAMGNPQQGEALYEAFINAVPCIIVSPAYTLSFQKPYPAAADDCYLAFEWMADNAESLGIDPARIIVGGESAGGNLACAVTLMARDRGRNGIAFQMPLYPMLDDTMQTASMKDNDAPVWCEESNQSAWALYLGEPAGTNAVEKYAAPFRETDYRNLPPAYTLVGSVDPFCDETLTYFQRLEAAGVSAECDVYEGCPHAFIIFDTKISRQAVEKLVSVYTSVVL